MKIVICWTIYIALIRYFSNYSTLHRSDLAARAAPQYTRLFYLRDDCCRKKTCLELKSLQLTQKSRKHFNINIHYNCCPIKCHCSMCLPCKVIHLSLIIKIFTTAMVIWLYENLQLTSTQLPFWGFLFFFFFFFAFLEVFHFYVTLNIWFCYI